MTYFAAYIPFLHPINWFQEWWYLLLLPLSFGISVIYRAVRMPSLEKFWRRVFVLNCQIVLAMIVLAIGLVLAVQIAIPMLPVS